MNYSHNAQFLFVETQEFLYIHIQMFFLICACIVRSHTDMYIRKKCILKVKEKKNEN